LQKKGSVINTSMQPKAFHNSLAAIPKSIDKNGAIVQRMPVSLANVRLPIFTHS
jgi:hypothetical protein